MTTIDLIVIVLVGIGLVIGMMKGFVKQFASIVGLVAGLLVARALFSTVADKLAPALGTSTTIAQILAFVLICVVVPLLFTLVASLLSKALDRLHLGWLNRLFGGVLGALKYIIVIGLVIHVFEYIDPRNEIMDKSTKEDSVFYYGLNEVANVFFPVLKNVTEQIIEM